MEDDGASTSTASANISIVSSVVDEEISQASLPPSSEDRKDELVTKKGGTSVIWKWFGFKKTDVEQKTVLCKLCRLKIVANSSNTTNLFSHLEHNHVLEHAESQRLRGGQKPGIVKKRWPTHRQTALPDSLTKCTPYDRKTQRWKDITKSITIHICKDMVPIQTVEKPGFTAMIKTLEPRYILPTRKYFSIKEIPQLYSEIRDQVQSEIANVTSFSTTTDMWSSRTSEPYMCLTVHYIDAEWRLHTKCLQTSYFPEDHTGEMIAQGLREALESWGLDEKRQVCMTTDNASNIKKALELNGWQRLQCFGHRLHLAIGK